MLAYLIVNYGYLAIFLGTAFEGEIVLVVAGFAAYLGYLDIGWVLCAGFVGSLVGDQIFFMIGRKHGQDFLARRPRWQKKADRVHSLFERHRYWLMLGFRFLYGFRVITPLVIGTSNIPARQFRIFNTFGALIWSVIFGFGGYLFGGTLEIFVKDIKRYEFKVILGIICVIVSFWLVIWLKRFCRNFFKS